MREPLFRAIDQLIQQVNPLGRLPAREEDREEFRRGGNDGSAQRRRVRLRSAVNFRQQGAASGQWENSLKDFINKHKIIYCATILDGPGLKKKIKSLPGGFPGIHFTSP